MVSSLFVEEIELSALFVEFVFAEVAQCGAVDDEFVINTLNDDCLHIVEVLLTNLDFLEYQLGAV